MDIQSEYKESIVNGFLIVYGQKSSDLTGTAIFVNEGAEAGRVEEIGGDGMKLGGGGYC